MKTLKQTIFNGKEGNCFAACIATVFEVGLDEVPNFAAFGSEWWDKLQDWLKPRNLAFIELEAKGGEMPAIPLLPDGVLCLACGMAARGFNHSVVVKYRSRDGKHWVELVHDPHPSDDGLQDTKYIGWFMVIDPSKPIRSAFPPVLDACCGSKGMWFDNNDDRAVFVDKRRETVTEIRKGVTGKVVIDPDTVADFTDLPFPSDTFALVVFDPPHIQREKPLGNMTKRYGHLCGDWREMLRKGFAECFRVLRPEGTLVFKWSEVSIPLRDVLALTQEKPLYGHRSGKASKTHWIAFLKPNSILDRSRPPNAGVEMSKAQQGGKAGNENADH